MTGYPRWRDLLFDEFDPLPELGEPEDPIGFPGYLDALSDARQGASSGEAAVAGLGDTGRHRVSAVLFDFSFLGGSMGTRVGDAVASACDAAVTHRLPLLVATSTGGARMQEGMAALAQMPRTVAAIAKVGDAGLPRIALLGHPTTGGVYASFATACDLLIAQSGATIGFAGPRVAEAFTGQPVPEGSHTAEMAFPHGLVDAVVERDQIRTELNRLLDLLAGPADPEVLAEPLPPGQVLDAWKCYELTRHADRPSPSFYLAAMAEGSFTLSGPRDGTNDPAVVAAVVRVDGRPAMFIALDQQSPSAAGYRKAQRAISIASRLGLPILTMVDTPGADPSFASEYAGLAHEISATFNALLKAPVPVVALTTGEGGSGGALALGVGDRVGIMRYAVFSVIAPEGAAAILHRDPTRAQEVAGQLEPTSESLVALGLADDIVEEPEGGAHRDPEIAAQEVKRWVIAALRTTKADPDLRQRRYSQLKLRRMR